MSHGFLSQYEAAYANDPDYIAEGLALQITEEATRLMVIERIDRAALAERMGVKSGEVTRIFNAPPTLTLRTIAKLALALHTVPRALIG